MIDSKAETRAPRGSMTVKKPIVAAKPPPPRNLKKMGQII